MEILGIGPIELIVVLILALVIFGPDRLPEIGAKLGSAMRGMRRATRDLSREIESTRQAIEAPLEEITKPLKEAVEPLNEVKKAAGAVQALRDPGKAIRDSVMREVRDISDEVTESISGKPETTAPATGSGQQSSDAITGSAASEPAGDAPPASEPVTAPAAEPATKEADPAEGSTTEG